MAEYKKIADHFHEVFKSIDRRRYTKERTVAGRQEVYDSTTGQWLLMMLVLNDYSTAYAHNTSPSLNTEGGYFGGGGASSSYDDCSSSSSYDDCSSSSSYDDCSSSSDSGGSSCGGD